MSGCCSTTVYICSASDAVRHTLVYVLCLDVNSVDYLKNDLLYSYNANAI